MIVINFNAVGKAKLLPSVYNSDSQVLSFRPGNLCRRPGALQPVGIFESAKARLRLRALRGGDRRRRREAGESSRAKAAAGALPASRRRLRLLAGAQRGN